MVRRLNQAMTRGNTTSEYKLCKFYVVVATLALLALTTCVFRVTFFPAPASYPTGALLGVIGLALVSPAAVVIVYKIWRTKLKTSNGKAD